MRDLVILMLACCLLLINPNYFRGAKRQKGGPCMSTSVLERVIDLVKTSSKPLSETEIVNALQCTVDGRCFRFWRAFTAM
jgi:hypothetical protein